MSIALIISAFIKNKKKERMKLEEMMQQREQYSRRKRYNMSKQRNEVVRGSNLTEEAT